MKDTNYDPKVWYRVLTGTCSKRDWAKVVPQEYVAEIAAAAVMAGDGRRILEEVTVERVRQDQKWGEQNHDPFKWAAILGEEVGEVNRAVLEMHFNEDPEMADDLRIELIQVAAVAVAAVQCMDRQGRKAELAEIMGESP